MQVQHCQKEVSTPVGILKKCWHTHEMRMLLSKEEDGSQKSSPAS
jgi:hypothetical protein